jgi:flagellar assembly factor FliW
VGVHLLKLDTSYFGEIKIDEEAILEFSEGILAFENLRKFVIIDSQEEELPFKWLQSVDEGDISFIMIDPFLFKPDYEVELSDQVIEKLEIESEEDVAIYTLLVIPENVNEMTANLAGPIVINFKKKLGKQVVLEDKRYHTKHRVIADTRKEDRNASTV